MILILSICAVIVAAMLAYFLFGAALAGALEREAVKMDTQARGERLCGRRCGALGLHAEAEWHAENARILTRNAQVCVKLAGWIA